MADKHKIHNWSEYNTNLINRGNIFFFFEEKDITPSKGIGKGKTCKYNDDF